MALGREPNLADIGLMQLGIQQNADHTIKVDPVFATNIPSIYALGDVVDFFLEWFSGIKAFLGLFFFNVIDGIFYQSFYVVKGFRIINVFSVESDFIHEHTMTAD